MLHEVMIVPLNGMIKPMRLADGSNLWGAGGMGRLHIPSDMILPASVSGYSSFLLRRFLRTLPRDVEKAARNGGCRELVIVWRMALAMSTLVLAALGIFAFQSIWSDYIWPLVISLTEQPRTLRLGLAIVASNDGAGWAMPLIGAVIATPPLIAFFVLAQRLIITGVNFGVGK